MIVLSKYTAESVFVKKNLDPHLPTPVKKLVDPDRQGFAGGSPSQRLVYSNLIDCLRKSPIELIFQKLFKVSRCRSF